MRAGREENREAIPNPAKFQQDLKMLAVKLKVAEEAGRCFSHPMCPTVQKLDSVEDGTMR